MEYGDPIPNSRYFRAFCPRCDAPVRVEEYIIKKNPTIFCEEFSLPHKGVGNPNPGWFNDTDAFKKANDQ